MYYETTKTVTCCIILDIYSWLALQGFSRNAHWKASSYVYTMLFPPFQSSHQLNMCFDPWDMTSRQRFESTTPLFPRDKSKRRLAFISSYTQKGRGTLLDPVQRESTVYSSWAQWPPTRLPTCPDVPCLMACQTSQSIPTST